MAKAKKAKGINRRRFIHPGKWEDAAIIIRSDMGCEAFGEPYGALDISKTELRFSGTSKKDMKECNTVLLGLEKDIRDLRESLNELAADVIAKREAAKVEKGGEQ